MIKDSWKNTEGGLAVSIHYKKYGTEKAAKTLTEIFGGTMGDAIAWVTRNCGPYKFATGTTTEGYDRIKLFMQKAGQATPDKPTIPNLETRKLRAKLILEEAFETIQDGLGLLIQDNPTKLLVDSERFSFLEGLSPNLIEIVDGCEDIRVVTTGTLIACGVRDAATSEEVDKNNLAKFGKGGYRRVDGKWVKPPNHKPPDIRGILIQQGWVP